MDRLRRNTSAQQIQLDDARVKGRLNEILNGEDKRCRWAASALRIGGGAICVRKKSVEEVEVEAEVEVEVEALPAVQNSATTIRNPHFKC